MKLRTFKKKYEGAAILDAELARYAATVDDDDIGQVARRFLEAQEAFYAALDRIGFERG